MGGNKKLSFESLSIFIVVCILFLSVETLNKKREKRFWILRFLLAIIFSLLAAFRSLEVPDTNAYVYNFNILTSNLTNVYMSYYEQGFTILSLLIKFLFGSNYKIYFFCITIINTFLISKSTKNLGIRLMLLPTILYLSFYGLYFNFVVIRAGLAFSLLLYSWSIFDNNRIKSMLFFLLACFFHQSSIFTGMVYIILFLKKKLSLDRYVIWIFLIGVLYLVKLDSLYLGEFIRMFGNSSYLQSQRFIYYLENNTMIEGISIRFLLNYLIGILLILSSRNKDIKYFNFLNIYLLGMSIIALFSSFTWIERVTDFFIATNFILLSFLIESLKDRSIKLLIAIPIIFANIFFAIRILNP